MIVDRDLAAANESADAVRAACAEAAVYQVDVTDEAAMNDLANKCVTSTAWSTSW